MNYLKWKYIENLKKDEKIKIFFSPLNTHHEHVVHSFDYSHSHIIGDLAFGGIEIRGYGSFPKACYLSRESIMPNSDYAITSASRVKTPDNEIISIDGGLRTSGEPFCEERNRWNSNGKKDAYKKFSQAEYIGFINLAKMLQRYDLKFSETMSFSSSDYVCIDLYFKNKERCIDTYIMARKLKDGFFGTKYSLWVTDNSCRNSAIFPEHKFIDVNATTIHQKFPYKSFGELIEDAERSILEVVSRNKVFDEYLPN